ncbi:glycosyltransferase family 4 protein [Providencia rettgeri]|uniref:glycosyltransferase family 4 protein n=1 Tax=Providencia rettgeri TaxID=587 RepID=UPI001E452B2A|nr:glycosyltransferase family 4 protein [Providencia rettgeri]UFK94537.1 glycosyltransferase family 4 protein [Providencia rettgeri]
MKLIYIIPSLENVGPTNVVLTLVKQLSINNKITIISFRNGILEEEFKKYCNVFITKNPITIFKLITNSGNSIIHSHGFYPDFLNALFSFFKITNNSFSTVHNFIKLDYTLLKGPLRGSLYAQIHKLILKLIKNPINCSKSAMIYNKISNYYIYNGVDDYYNRNKERINAKKIKVVYLGVLNKRKNPYVFLEAFKIKNRKNIELYIVGNGPDYESLKSTYESDNIKFMGKVEKPFTILNDCDFIISSSLAEGFPLAILEGLSCGLSYILSNIPPHEEIHKLANQNGFLINNEVSSFEQIFSLLENFNPNEFKNNCRELYLENFTTKKMVNEYASLYMSSTQ